MRDSYNFEYPSATVYGVVLNDHRTMEAIANRLNKEPYEKPPVAPVLYIKPRTTWLDARPGNAAVVEMLTGTEAIEISATIGIVLRQTASRLQPGEAMDYVRGIRLMADVSIPNPSYHRMFLREKCFDRSCPMGPETTLSGKIESRVVRTFADERLVNEHYLGDLVRGVPQLLSDITEFMTLAEGDVLMVGIPWNCPLAGAGTEIRVSMDGVKDIIFTLATERGPA